MSFSSEKLKIIIKKNDMRIRPSTKLKATEGRTGCKYGFTASQVRLYHGSVAGTPTSGTGPECGSTTGTAALVALVDVAQPVAMKRALVNSSGAATNRRTLKISAKTIEPAAAAVVPFFNSSLGRF